MSKKAVMDQVLADTIADLERQRDTVDNLLASIPDDWRLMALADDDGERGFYCCLRTRQPTRKDYWPAAVAYGASYVEAIKGAIKATKEAR